MPQIQQSGGELIGTLRVRGGALEGGVIEGALTAALIDEIPVLAVLGARSEKGLTVRDASELRVKETDRIATLGANFERMGVSIEVRPDGFHIPGKQKFHGGEVDSFGDHRIAMAFAVAALGGGRRDHHPERRSGFGFVPGVLPYSGGDCRWDLMKYLCIHGHFYQPPRENPWLEALELQDSAYPYHDWNERITAECYAPNAAARTLDGDGHIVNISTITPHQL